MLFGAGGENKMLEIVGPPLGERKHVATSAVRRGDGTHTVAERYRLHLHDIRESLSQPLLELP